MSSVANAPSDSPIVAVICFFALAVWMVHRSYRPLRVMLDWDLTCDCMSTPGDEDVRTNNARRKFRRKTNMSVAEEVEYMSRLRVFLEDLLARQRNGELAVYIVTRNSAENVRWMLEHVVRVNPEDFVVLSDVEQRANKAEMLQRYLCLKDEDMEGVVVLVDDSSSEHKKAAKHAKNRWADAKLKHVRVVRPGKGAPYFNQEKREPQYGIMNQEEALDALGWATHKFNLW